MAWRDVFYRRLGPGLLAGITPGDWLRLLRANRFDVDPPFLPRALAITSQSLQNGAIQWREDRAFGPKFKEVAIPPPLFVLGHWRSGTTHLHNLITVDARFAFPNTFQTSFPHTFLTTEAVGSRLMAGFLPKRRPMDNIEWSLATPQEDEFALNVATAMSPYMGWAFSRHRDRYDKYLTLRGVPEAEVARWRKALVTFLKKLTWKYGRPLVLKSPPHTCRIGLLMGMFPGAKFVHIHRDPYTVFQSSRRTFRVSVEISGLQRPQLDDLDDWVLRQYRTLYDAFFEERGLIPEGHYHEVGFEQLEADPIGEMKRLYEALDLPDFAQVEAALKGYVASIAGYKKNEFPDLPAEARGRVAEAWRPCFDEWGYPA